MLTYLRSNDDVPVILGDHVLDDGHDLQSTGDRERAVRRQKVALDIDYEKRCARAGTGHAGGCGSGYERRKSAV